MADDIHKYLFGSGYWPGGSGDLGSAEWLTGYNFDLTTFEYLNLVSDFAPADVIFGGLLPAPYELTNINVGGDLSGDLGVNSFGMTGSIAFTLLGTLSASSGAVGFGNSLTVAAGALLSATDLLADLGSITNNGSIAGDVATSSVRSGVYVGTDGCLTNQAGATISGYYGVEVFAGATLVNSGIIASGSLAAAGYGVKIFGAISGIDQAAGVSSVTNQAHATISGHFGIGGSFSGTVVNAGLILGGTNVASGVGVNLVVGGITNQSGATISGYTGVTGTLPDVTIANYGAIAGNTVNGAGILFNQGGTVTNQSSATISGYYGVKDLSSSATVVNAGTISGKFAVQTAGVVVVDPGAVFNGKVNAATLELASSASVGTLSGLNSQFIHVARINVDAGANWILTGSNIMSGETLTNKGSVTIAGGGGQLSGHGLIDGPIENDGMVLATSGSLKIDGPVSGTGDTEIGQYGTLELTGSFSQSGTIDFLGNAPATLLLDDPTEFQGKIQGLYAGDQIVIPNSILTDDNQIVSATIVDLNGVPTLQIFLGAGPTINLLAQIPVKDAGNDSNLIGQSLQISQSTDGLSTILTVPTTKNSGFIINESYDASIPAASASVAAGYEYAISQAARFFETAFTNAATINIGFGWREVGGVPIPANGSGASRANWSDTSYSALLAAISNVDTTSAVQLAALASLPNTDPTNGATFQITSAESKAWGLSPANPATDGSVGLSAVGWGWSPATIGLGDDDAVSTLEHEISEVLGRADDAGAIVNGKTEYTLLDMFRYTALSGFANAAVSSPVGFRDEPFAPGYSTTAPASAAPGLNSFSYFSYNGATVTLPYDTPDHVAAGQDVADWAATVLNDSFGYGTPGQADPVSIIDLQEMNVLGFDRADCYAAGTRIDTARGELRVEDLRIGDRVTTLLTAAAQPVKWIGRWHLHCSRHPDPRAVWPVRVTAGAFGDNVPRRDLWLSPDHAVFVDRMLIPIKYLINGRTIEQVPKDEVTYYHVELEQHDVLAAEGLPCESYLDTGDRAKPGATRRYADCSSAGCDVVILREAKGCAPMVVAGRSLTSVRTRLLRRAVANSRPPDAPARRHAI